MKVVALGLAVLVLGAPSVAFGQNPDFDPRVYRQQVQGEKTRVLVLGTPHLSNAGEGFDPTVLEPLLDRLAAFDPTIITVENLSGESLYGLREFSDIYEGTADYFGRPMLAGAALGQLGTGLDMPQAEAQARLLLATWPEAPTAEQRRRLAALFASAGDLNSALVQWWRLEAADRRAGDGVGRYLADYLDRYGAQTNESQLIGARLAARLGLERVYPIDDQANADIVQPRIRTLMGFLEQPDMRSVFNDPAFERLNLSATRLLTPEQVLTTYREVNSPETARLDTDTQWLSMINRPSPEGIGRTQVAGWEARNLRQVANIREVTANSPGARVLVIVGSSHKPWFEAYLSMLSDIELVDAQGALQ